MKYPKLNKKENCAYPEREICNYTETKPRCEYMKFDKSCSIFDANRWKCTYKKNDKNI